MSGALKRAIFYDLETTGFGREAEILQIGACIGDLSFKTYVKPDGPTSSKAEKVHKITRMHTDNAPRFSEAWALFSTFVEEALRSLEHSSCASAPHFPGSYPADAICIVGYNNWSFDDRVLWREIQRRQLTETPLALRLARCGYSFDLRASVRKEKLRDTQGKQKLSDIYKFLTGKEHDNAHDALSDVQAVREICPFILDRLVSRRFLTELRDKEPVCGTSVATQGQAALERYSFRSAKSQKHADGVAHCEKITSVVENTPSDPALGSGVSRDMSKACCAQEEPLVQTTPGSPCPLFLQEPLFKSPCPLLLQEPLFKKRKRPFTDKNVSLEDDLLDGRNFSWKDLCFVSA